MALQSQTYANSGYAYYIQGGTPNNPSSITALNSPVEILFTSTIKGEYYGDLNQTPSTFTISENLTSTLSTINFLTMDPVNEVTQMGINDVLNPLGEPVIQQWTRTDSIVNGRFKVGNKNLGDEPNALNVFNNIQKTSLQQNTIIQTMDGLNERFRFTNIGLDPFVYTEIGASIGNTGTVKCASDGFGGIYANTTMEPTKIIFNNGALQGNATLGVNNGAPYQFYTSSKNAIEFVVDDIGAVITPLSLNKDGTVTMVSTLTVPYVSTTNIRATSISTTNISGTNATLDNISTLALNQKIGSVITDTPIVVNGSMRINTQAGINGAPGINYLQSPRLRVINSGIEPKVYYPPGLTEGEIIYDTLRGNYGAPNPGAVGSMEFIQNSGNLVGGFQFYHGQNGSSSSPEWLGGFTYNPKQFILASTMTASLPNIANTQSASILNLTDTQNASISNITSTLTASISSLTNVGSINGDPINTFGIPTGSMIAWCPYVPTPPPGYLIADGSLVLKSAYASLFSVIGDTYTSSPQPTTFRLPNMCGRAPYGSVGTLANNTPTPNTVTLQIVSSVAITTPTGVVTGLYVLQSLNNGIIYRGMTSSTPGMTMTIKTIIHTGADQSGLCYIIPDLAYPIDLVGTYGLCDFSFVADVNAITAPYVGNNNATTTVFNQVPGLGYAQYPMVPDEIAPHVHSGRNGGNTVSAPGTTRTEPASGDTGYNTDVYYVGGIACSENMRYIPPNVSTWFIIKT